MNFVFYFYFIIIIYNKNTLLARNKTQQLNNSTQGSCGLTLEAAPLKNKD